MNKEEFDRSVCFTFFNDYHEQIMRVEKAYGVETAFDVYKAIVNYGLYEKEIDDEKLQILVGASTLTKIDSSQSRRSRGFAGEDLEMSRSIILMHLEHPEYSQNKIVNLTKASKGKVNKTLQKYNNNEYEGIIDLGTVHCNVVDTGSYIDNGIDSNIDICSYTDNDTVIYNYGMTTTMTEPMTDYASTTDNVSFDDVSTEIIYAVYELFQCGKSYAYISNETGLSGKKIHAIIEDGKEHRFAAPEDRPFS